MGPHPVHKLQPALQLMLVGLILAAGQGRQPASAQVPAAEAGTAIDIVYGTDVTFTAMNFHETAFLDDPNNVPLPDPSTRSATASGNAALAMNAASPGQAGSARARVGLFYELLPGAFDWDDIKDIPLDVRVTFAYSLTANYTSGQGSANAGLGIRPVVPTWYDFLGAETAETGTRSDAATVTYSTTFASLGDKLYLEAYSQAHLTLAGAASNSQAQLMVTSITFDFGPLPAELSADALEVTQAVQDLGNSVRLVADKRTFVRLHASSNGSTYRTFAQLEIEVGPIRHIIYPSTPGYQVNVRGAPNRGVATHAFLFEIPTAFTGAGTLEITAVLNPDTTWRDRSPAELNYDNNTIARTVTFESVPQVNLVVHQMIYNLNGTNHAPSLGDAVALPDWMRRAFPLSRLRVWHRVTRYDSPATVLTGTLTNPTCDHINSQLLSLRRWDRVFGSAPVPTGVRYYGMVADSGGYMRGCADLPGPTASGPSGVPGGNPPWDTDGTYGDWYGGHELAHAYGRGHANFCDADGGPAYPYPAGKISPVASGATALYGFDIKTRAIYNAHWKDVMTYCPFQWIGDFTYEALMTAFQTMPVLAELPAGAVGDYLTVSGIVDAQTGGVEMDPVYLLEDVENPLPPVAGDYAIIQRNSGGAALSTVLFTPQEIETGAPNPDGGPALEQHFLLIDEMVPAMPGMASIEITGPSGTLATITAGAATPSVTLTSPNGGETLAMPEVSVAWTAADTDGDPLAFTLQYSSDSGATWRTVASDLVSQSVTINTLNLPGSPTALFRVWASDGLHSASDELNATFAVPNHPPFAFIEQPPTDITVVVSETVGLKAMAYDVESGTLDPAMLSWTSNLDGPLGPGDQLSLANLTEGVHTVTFLAEDGQGAGITDTVVITVSANPTLTPGAANQLIAGPSLTDLGTTTASVTGTLYIENQNLDVALDWTAAVSESWISLSAASGTTPAEITLSHAGVSLAPGTHTGTITLTSEDLPGQSVVVFVQIVKPGGRIYLPLVAR